MIHSSAPGKLMISGEWAVLDVGNPCIVAAVNKRVHCRIEDSDDIFIELKDFGISSKGIYQDGKLSLENDDEKFLFTKKSIETVFKYLGKSKPFRMVTWGEDTNIGSEKVGFGSSAAAVVAIVGGMLKYMGHDPGKEETYKISAIVHYFAQGKIGSAFDIAASTYGGVIVYKRFDSNWLVKEIESSKNIRDVVSKRWPGFYAEEIGMPKGMIFLVGWTGNSASTSAMVKQLNAWAEGIGVGDKKRIYGLISSLVGELVTEWKEGRRGEMVSLLRRNEDYLRELGQKSGVGIETEKLKILSDSANSFNGAGKLSGAGGGDCGIAVCFDTESADNIKKKWRDNGITPIEVTIDKRGFVLV